MTEGPNAGKFLFSADTLGRAETFYNQVRDLPDRRPVPLEDIVALRELMPGWMIPIATIKQLPHWMTRVVLDQAVWKWIATLLLILILVTVIRLARRLLNHSTHSGDTVLSYVNRLALPILVIALMKPAAYLITEQINFIGDMARAANLITNTIIYVLATWVVWLSALMRRN